MEARRFVIRANACWMERSQDSTSNLDGMYLPSFLTNKINSLGHIPGSGSYVLLIPFSFFLNRCGGRVFFLDAIAISSVQSSGTRKGNLYLRLRRTICMLNELMRVDCFLCRSID